MELQFLFSFSSFSFSSRVLLLFSSCSPSLFFLFFYLCTLLLLVFIFIFIFFFFLNSHYFSMTLGLWSETAKSTTTPSLNTTRWLTSLRGLGTSFWFVRSKSCKASELSFFFSCLFLFFLHFSFFSSFFFFQIRISISLCWCLKRVDSDRCWLHPLCVHSHFLHQVHWAGKTPFASRRRYR